MTPFAAIDFETAGYAPASACSLGIVAANEDGSVTEWHRLIRPPVMRFAPGCIAIHGIRPEDVEDKPEFPAFWPEIASLLRGRVVFAHNAQFDLNFLNAECENCGLPVTKNQAVDTLQLSRILIPEAQYHKLDFLADFLGIDKGSSHRALDDAITCMELFKKCLERR